MSCELRYHKMLTVATAVGWLCRREVSVDSPPDPRLPFHFCWGVWLQMGSAAKAGVVHSSWMLPCLQQALYTAISQ